MHPMVNTHSTNVVRLLPVAKQHKESILSCLMEFWVAERFEQHFCLPIVNLHFHGILLLGSVCRICFPIVEKRIDGINFLLTELSKNCRYVGISLTRNANLKIATLNPLVHLWARNNRIIKYKSNMLSHSSFRSICPLLLFMLAHYPRNDIHT